jgi:hypothetical protein
MVSRSKPVRWLTATAAAATALAGGLPLLTPDRYDWIGPALALLGVVITVGVGKYTEDNTTPWADVAAKVTPTGRIVSGPADKERPTGAGVDLVSPARGAEFMTPPGPVPDPNEEFGA